MTSDLMASMGAIAGRLSFEKKQKIVAFGVG